MPFSFPYRLPTYRPHRSTSPELNPHRHPPRPPEHLAGAIMRSHHHRRPITRSESPPPSPVQPEHHHKKPNKTNPNHLTPPPPPFTIHPMNTPHTTPEALAPEYLAELITNMTGTQWEWEHTGGGCMALIAHFPDNTYAMITDEGLSDEIAPDDAVSLGIYPDNDEHYDEAIRFTTYPTLTDLIADIAIALIDNLPEHLAWWCPTCKTTNPTTLTTCRTCQAPQH